LDRTDLNVKKKMDAVHRKLKYTTGKVFPTIGNKTGVTL
jgi:tetrahydromethanopterin S-methyltransferase subunit G